MTHLDGGQAKRGGQLGVPGGQADRGQRRKQRVGDACVALLEGRGGEGRGAYLNVR